MTSGKTIALTRWTFVGKVMSLLFKEMPQEAEMPQESWSLSERVQTGSAGPECVNDLEGPLLKLWNRA